MVSRSEVASARATWLLCGIRTPTRCSFYIFIKILDRNMGRQMYCGSFTHLTLHGLTWRGFKFDLMDIFSRVLIENSRIMQLRICTLNDIWDVLFQTLLYLALSTPSSPITAGIC